MLLTHEQEMIRDSVRAFARERLAPFAAEWDRNATFPREALAEMGRMGLMGVCVPERWGGAGLDHVSLALALEEIAAGDGACSTILSVQNSVVCGPINAFGTDAQKARWLKPLAAGEKLGCFCLTEPHVGSDAARDPHAAPTSGDGAHWVLNGVKQFITTGKNADYAVVFAVSDKGAGKRGISAFVVPAETPGYVVARVEHKLGQRASDTAQIVFEDCRVPADSLLGAEGEGYRIALSNLEGGRIGIAAQAVGMARAAYEAALAYAKAARDVRQADHRAPGGELPSRRHGDEDRSRAPDGAGTPRPCATPSGPASRRPRWPSSSRARWPRRSAPRRSRFTAATAT